MVFWNKIVLRVFLVSAVCLANYNILPAQPTATKIRVHENGRFFQTTESGAPFFWLNDTGWGVFEYISKEDAEVYIQDRKDKGFTGFLACIGFESSDSKNFYGDNVWNNNDPLQPNEAYFSNVDYILQKTKDAGLFVGLLPSWGDKVTGSKQINEDNAYQYGQYLGKRYQNQNSNIIWVLGGDHPREGQQTEIEVYRKLAEGITDGVNDINNQDGKADFATTMITFHVQQWETSAMYFHEENWLDFNLMQTGHAKRNNTLAFWHLESAYRKQPAKPVMDGEAPYEDHGIGWNLVANGFFTAHDVRKSAYWSVFAGACGHVYGSHTIWQFASPGKIKMDNSTRGWWNMEKDGLPKGKDLPGAFDMTHLKDLLLSRPYFDREPAQKLIVRNTLESSHTQATMGKDGSYAFVYFPSAYVHNNLKVELLSGDKINAWWYSPRDGKTYNEKGVESNQPFVTFNKENRGFSPPGSVFSEDWVLVLEDASKEYKTPGKYSFKN